MSLDLPQQPQFDDLQRRVTLLEATAKSLVMPIQTLHPHPIEVFRDLLAVVQFEEGAWLASFIDANIHASGEDQQDALDELRETIAARFLLFTKNEHSLGDEPRRQLAVLRNFMRAT